MFDEIQREMTKIRRERSEKLITSMKEYDEIVYLPSIMRLQEKCAKSGGHIKGRYHNNGLGWSWYYCSRCEARMEITSIAKIG
jgi:hypothetical protein